MRPVEPPGETPHRRRLRPGMGCAAASVLLLAFLLFAGHVVFRKGVAMVVARAAVRLGEVPSPEISESRSEALREALRRWVRAPRRGPEGERAEGRFLALAQEILADGRMDPEEAARLERFLAGEDGAP